MKYNIAVVGAGPAGIIGAGIASSRGHKVSLIEKNNKIGRKLFITGKGRCNITNASYIQEFFENIVKNEKFLYSSFYSYTNEDIIKLLNDYGLTTKVERGDRVFPESDKSSDVIKAFESFLVDKNVNIRLNTNVSDIKYKDGLFYLKINGEESTFDKVLLATGGKSYPSTGSTGDGYKFAKSLGHKIIDISPSLVPLEIKEEWVKRLQGLSLRNVSINAYYKDKNIYEDFGEMIFTHYGISGPIVLSMSNYIDKYSGKNIKISIDLKPALDEEKLDERILKDFKKYNNKQFKNGLDDLFPKKLIPTIVDLSGIDPYKTIHQITKEEREKLLHLIKNLTMTFKSFRPIEEAIVTSGGVDTKEINPSTMESKLVPGLYLAGELIDVHGLTGGYNLQIAYSTGYLAGSDM